MKIKDIAAMSGVSVATVSRVLNNDQRVKTATRRRVMEVIEETGYKPNTMGRNLRKNKSNNILALVPTLNNQIYARLLHGTEEKAMENGYEMLIAVTHRRYELEKKYLDMLYTRQVDGAITYMSFLDEEYLDATAKRFPLVLCSGTAKCDHLSYTCIDNARAAYDATQHILSLGHTKIARLNSTFSPTYEGERTRGFCRAMTGAGIESPKEYLFDDGYSYEDGYNYTKILMGLRTPPTAILAFSDIIASGCIKFLMEHGLRPGVDVDVMGFDDIQMGEVIIPSLSTVSMPLRELGAVAFDLLLERMESQKSVRKGIILDHKLTIRDSTRKEPI